MGREKERAFMLKKMVSWRYPSFIVSPIVFCYVSLFAHLLPKFPFATAAVIKDLAVLSLRGPKTLLMKEWGAPIVPARRTLIVIEGVATAAFSSVAQCKTDFPTIKGNLSPLHFEKERVFGLSFKGNKQGHT